MSIPDLKVEIAFDSGFATAEGDRTWTDVTTDVVATEGVWITYGRVDTQSSADPNTCTLTLKNATGKYTPGNTGSTFYPNVKKGKPLRVSVRYNAVWYIRFTGYINEWPVVWPDGGDLASQVTITASSRRARLGQTAPLTSAIRAAYLASEPDAYWPMRTDDPTIFVTNTQGKSVFRDITNTPIANKQTQSIAGFYTDVSTAPTVNTGVLGPTDEGELVKFPALDGSSAAWEGGYVGAGGCMSINTSPPGDFSAEMVARLNPQPHPDSEEVSIVLFRVGSANLRQEMYCFLFDDTTSNPSSGGKYVGVYMIIRDDDSTIVHQPSWYVLESGIYEAVTDGELHHFALVSITPSPTETYIALFVDGLQVSYTYSSTYVFTEKFTTLAIGNIRRNCEMYAGHMAVYDRFLDNPGEMDEHAFAAIAASETVEERVVRVAGRIGIPEDEIDVETTIATDVGSQAEAGRSATEVLDELAASTGSIIYDTRDGHLAMQARNHRYNADTAFTLTTDDHEIEVDLTVVLDDQYLKNTVEFTRTGSENVPTTVVDQDSVDAYGVYATTLSIVSSSDTEVEAAANDILYRYAEPGVRVSRVSVDVVDLDTAQRALVLDADVGTLFEIADLPPQAPTDPMPLFFEGATETISADGHVITINTTPGDLYQNVLILDDASLGLLDSGNVLAY